MTKRKVIRDTVHGNIIVEGDIIENLIDSPYFQRLRHVEQSSVRALFPTARHDRFVHSLGVFHIGDLIAKHIEEEGIKDFSDEELHAITRSYRIACLLHDVAHAPFSHTFEKCYGIKSELYSDLCKKLKLTGNLEREQIDDIKQHELASAILITDSDLKEAIRDTLKGDIELICRMIIGWKYSEDTPSSQVKNCFIELLHGDVIDADRIDYACRDVWASGYSTATIDVQRLVNAMHIRKNPSDEYVVCYNVNALSDVINVLSVRLFQNRHILTHHTVVYEQLLMIKAAECMAKHRYPKEKNAEASLARIINLKSVINSNKVGKYTFSHFCDDDLFFLMKQDTNNPFFEEISARKYTRFALWKTPSEFYHLFPQVPKTAEIVSAKMEEKIFTALKAEPGVNNIIFKEVEFKPQKKLDDLWVLVSDEVKRHREICPNFMIDSSICDEFRFSFVFVPYPENMDVQEYKKHLVEILSPIMTKLFA